MSTGSDRAGGLYASTKSVSTGVSGIDCILGGGISGGSIVLIEESKRLNGFADAIAKQFISEGFYRQNRIYFASDGTTSCSDFLRTLPQVILNESRDQGPLDSSIPLDMEIAWRYEHLPVKNVQVRNDRRQQAHRLDFTKSISEEDLRTYKHLNVYDVNLETLSNFTSHYGKALSQLRSALNTAAPSGDQDGARWHRIVIRHVGSPLWQSDSEKEGVIEFLASLRAFVRQKSTAVAMITISTAFVADESPLLLRLRQLADLVLRLDPIGVGGKEKSQLDYHGLLRCLRTPSINSIHFPIPDSMDYGFKLRKEFLIERLHLPPDLSETASRNQLDGFSCSSSSSRSKLDF